MRDVSVLTIILNYKTPEMTLKSAAAAIKAMEQVKGEIVIVDNMSDDGSFEEIVSGATKNGWLQNGMMRVIQSGLNGGFGAGNNVGIRAGMRDGSAPDYYYILNSDAFPAPSAIRLLQENLEADDSIGFAGSFTHGPEGDAHMTAFRFPSIAGEFEGAARFGPISRLLKDHSVAMPTPKHSVMVDWLAGASLMIRARTLDEIGMFDEKFFLYFEETDLCLRGHRAGWPTLFVSESEVCHIGSVSTGMRSWARVPGYWFDSRLYYYTKNYGAGYASKATLAHIAGALVSRLRSIIQLKPRIDPPNLLRDMTIHGIKALGRGIRGRQAPKPPSKTAINFNDQLDRNKP